jgi:hypothetical protein
VLARGLALFSAARQQAVIEKMTAPHNRPITELESFETTGV